VALCAARGLPLTPITRADVDLRDAEAVARTIPTGRVVLHCAAPVPRTMDDYADERAARDGLDMVRALLTTKPARFVFASSMTVYRDAPSPVREEDAPPPGQGYVGGKRRAELLIEESGVPAMILRLPGLFGPPRRGGFLYNAARAVAAGEDFTIGARPRIWAALHVDDAAEAMIRAAELSVPPQILNVGYEGRFSLDRALEQLRGDDLDDASGFEMDLTQMRATIGKLPGTWLGRLATLLEEAAHA
jgi:nucleoside-diphosphate-sugar epimerase